VAEITVKRLRSGGLITNYFCTSRCGHCLYNCSPRWKKHYIDPETAEKNLLKVRSLGCRSVHIGGGEPMLRPGKLGNVLETADRVGVAVDYVETNSSWFRDLSSATAILSRLKAKGLGTLLISISPFHNEHIPFDRVTGVVEAARQAGVGVFPWISDFVSDLSAFDEERTHSLEEYRQMFGPDYLQQVLQRYWIHMGGRALETFRPLLAAKTFEQIIDENPVSCAAELSDTSHFHIDLFGNFIPGLCSGLAIERDDLDTRLSGEKYPIIMTLYTRGIRGLADITRKAFGYQPGQALYLNKCDLCTEIRTFWVQSGYSGSRELRPEEFYAGSHSQRI